MTTQYFEGPEKKVELVVRPGFPSLRELDREVWHAVVGAARARILSTCATSSCDAYLLSESSLFVYGDHLTLITCGQTRLVEAVRRILEVIPPADVALLMYERKNEFFPELQATTFLDDARALSALLPGEALQFGADDAPHVFLFTTQADYRPDANDTTLEVLMHDIDGALAARFEGAPEPRQDLARQSGLAALLPGFEFDEHHFTPSGYSLNALRGADYATVHVTPERPGRYVSFETNLDFRPDPSVLVHQVVETFRPHSFIVMAFSPTPLPPLALTGWQGLDQVEVRRNGYHIAFSSWAQPLRGPREPRSLPL